MKPTYGRVSRYGLVAFASSLDQIGPFARTVADAALLLEVIAGHDPLDSTSIPEPMPPLAGHARPTASRACASGSSPSSWARASRPTSPPGSHDAAAALETAGAKVEEASVPAAVYGLSAYYLIAPAEASSNLARYDGVRYGLRVDGATTGEMTTPPARPASVPRSSGASCSAPTPCRPATTTPTTARPRRSAR